MLAVCLAVLAAAAAAVAAWPERGPTPPVAQTEQIDLSRWNFVRNGSVSLSGDWSYYDESWTRGRRSGGVVAHVPGPWPAVDARTGRTRSDGFGTYVLRLRLPAAPQGDSFALDTGQTQSAYRVIANGKVIAAPGVPGTSAETERGNNYSTLAALPENARDVEIDYEISNHLTSDGGIYTAPTVGLKSALKAKRKLTEKMLLVVFGVLVFTACYHIAFMGVTRAGYANVWFGVLAALFGIRLFLLDPLAADTVLLLGQDWVWRLDFATTDFLFAAATWFLALSFPKHVSRTFAIGLTVVSGTLSLSSLVGGPTVGLMSLKVFELTGLIVLPYLIQAIVRAALDRDHGADLALLGVVICSIAGFHDILLENIVIAGPNFLPLGCVAFFLCLSGALTQRSHHAFVSTELLVDERTRQLHEKIAELELARSAAEQANAAKSRFLANMSHELRTPLNAILGFSEIIRDRLMGADAQERYTDYAASIHSSGGHLLGLINDILDLSKIEAGKLDLVDTHLDLGEEGRSALRLLEPQARRKNIRLSFHDSLPGLVLADARAMRQIFVNLLSNAVKFTPEGGSVALSLSSRPDRSIVIAIADNGIGIRPEDMTRVFESFGQARHDVRARDENGTGLGLPIVKGLVEALGGRVEIESKPNAGTTMTVVLPARRNVSVEPTSNAA